MPTTLRKIDTGRTQSEMSVADDPLALTGSCCKDTVVEEPTPALAHALDLIAAIVLRVLSDASKSMRA